VTQNNRKDADKLLVKHSKAILLTFYEETFMLLPTSFTTLMPDIILEDTKKKGTGNDERNWTRTCTFRISFFFSYQTLSYKSKKNNIDRSIRLSKRRK
jgi:hypothetical protein